MEETTNWDPTYENEDQNDDNKRNDSADSIFNKNEHRKADDDKENKDDEAEERGSDWGSVDPQEDGRPSSNDPSGPGSAV